MILDIVAAAAADQSAVAAVDRIAVAPAAKRHDLDQSSAVLTGAESNANLDVRLLYMVLKANKISSNQVSRTFDLNRLHSINVPDGHSKQL